MASEHQQVEVDLARAPALARLAAERSLEALEGDEQRGGAGRRDPGRPGRRAPRPRSGTRAGRGRRRAPSRRGARRPGAARPGARRARGSRPRGSPTASPTFAPSPTYARTFATACVPPVARLGRMPPVTVLILAPEPVPGASPLVRLLDDARTALAERHRRRVPRGRRGRGRRPPRATRCYAVRGAAPAAGGGAAAGRPRGPGRGRDPARDRRRTGGRSSRPRRAERPAALANHRYSADVVAIACAPAVARRAARRPRAPTTRCPAGSPRSRASRCATCGRGDGWRWTWTRRWTCCCSSGRCPGSRSRRTRDAAPVRDRLADAPAPGGRPRRRAPGRGTDVRHGPALARDPHAVADAGARRGARAPDGGDRRGARPAEPAGPAERARRAAGRRRRARAPRAASSRASPTGPCSTRASCWPTASAPTRPRWPPPEDRFASDLLLADAVRDPWLAELTAAPRTRRSRSCSAVTRSSDPGLRLALAGGAR